MVNQLHERCVLISPSDAEEWAAYHRIRRTILFENRGIFGVYDPNRPEEHEAGKFPKLLVFDSQLVGVVRIDLSGETAYLRRVAIDEPWQRRGLGRALLALAESFAQDQGASQIESSVAPDAKEFYRKCGYSQRPFSSQRSSVHMYKNLK